MQGVDAALAATKPGEIDFVTRSRIEATARGPFLEFVPGSVDMEEASCGYT